MILPIPLDTFFNLSWERKPILAQRRSSSYNNGLFSSHDLDRIVRENYIEYSVNLDVTTYENGVRETHNAEGRVLASVMWDYYQNGCSIRMLNPQTYSESLWKFCSLLQEYFGSFVGCNMYLTPPGTQGFAPHFDDIEAFVLQLEGKKKWRFYNPRDDSEILPEYSSGNFNQNEIGKPSFEFVLEQGDFAYFPRGTIHQAQSLPDCHSLHITVSTCQLHSFGKYFEKLLPMAIRSAFKNNLGLRKSLPPDFFANIGGIHADSKNARRKQLTTEVKQFLKDIIDDAPIDEAADLFAAGVIHDYLPPCHTQEERNCMIFTTGGRWNGSGVVSCVTLNEDNRIKLVRREVARLVKGDSNYQLHFSTENSKVYHGYQPQFIELPCEMIDAVKYLFNSYPDYKRVGDLPGSDKDIKVDLANVLYEKGIIMTQFPISR
ncbi:uncharacterized protein TRIADDRAFT_50673 [Trichoplax adhaerens]|uniref:Bifunctional lysine-specific demethylase and histidyl-hydroxylase n=1 Tax=Trichoplax adhaerens TaxID=10228 RepID=B3S582_TRIAD|nr:hypothetical protein TRIADDRAFT_50673 [Trichoplax adhaerens]EDV22217.1 hypothetical protein TRIADDRAFT_50673 [Trichoplax adhaerens]|eukprot:XP_002115372.1 hypothetical protein TRIADDRAFT_50673 [Trichoplax adhaerens]